MRQRFALFGLAVLALASCRPAGEGAPGGATGAAPSGRPTGTVTQGDASEAAAPRQASNVLVGVWRLVTYQAESGFEEAVAANERYTIEFTADGRVAGQADCNRYFGGYSEPSPGRLALTNLGATLAACPPESRSTEFLRAVGSATRYELVGGELKLFGGGEALTLAREQPAAATPEAPATPAAPSTPEPAGEPQAAAPEVGRTFVYDCGSDVSFTVRTGPGEVALWAPASVGGAYLVLAHSRAASGARYSEGDTVFWSKGELATFEIGGQRFVDCRSNPAKVPWADAARRGVVFRGLGQEPGWNVEIERDGRMVLVADYGARRIEAVNVHAEPTVESLRTTYRSANDPPTFAVVIERRTCTDSMSGEAFEAAVTVTLESDLLYGCGRFL